MNITTVKLIKHKLVHDTALICLYCISTILGSTTVRYHSCVLLNSYLTNMDDHHCIRRFVVRITKRALFRASVYLVAVLGCALQSDYICQDYFRYPTTTYFSIVDSLSQITPPTLTLSFPYEAKIGTTLKALFASLKDNVTVRHARIKEV